MQKAYTVAQVNTYIKNMFSQDYMLQTVSVKGEASNVKYHSSGHIYFTLKDKSSVLACVMFAGSRSGLSFPLQEGMQVVVSGNIDVYVRDGRYQMYAKNITKEGVGELFEKFELLKQELEARGLFAPEYKQPIPQTCRKLGVVTAPTGAAVRDIISIAKTRNPYIEIILYPALVQGEGAAPSIVKGIKALENYGVDTIIVGRGGGSMEDLWAFNEEIVAQAIFDCSIPIISAVGHETDITIADFVADKRAETPSAAAQIAVCDMAGMVDSIAAYRDRLVRNMKTAINTERQKISVLQIKLKKSSPENKIRDMRYATMQFEEKLRREMKEAVESRRNRLGILISRLNGVSPLEKLSQGYSYTRGANGQAVKHIADVKTSDTVDIFVTDGVIRAVVEDTEKLKWES